MACGLATEQCSLIGFKDRYEEFTLTYLLPVGIPLCLTTSDPSGGPGLGVGLHNNKLQESLMHNCKQLD